MLMMAGFTYVKRRRKKVRESMAHLALTGPRIHTHIPKENGYVITDYHRRARRYAHSYTRTHALTCAQAQTSTYTHTHNIQTRAHRHNHTTHTHARTHAHTNTQTQTHQRGVRGLDGKLQREHPRLGLGFVLLLYTEFVLARSTCE